MKKILLLLLIAILLPISSLTYAEEELTEECLFETSEEFGEFITEKEQELSDEEFVEFYYELNEKIHNLARTNTEDCRIKNLPIDLLLHGLFSDAILEDSTNKDEGVKYNLEMPETLDIEKDKRIGMGVMFKYSTYRPYVVDVFENSPAEKAGFQEGDIILEINGQVIINKPYISLVSGVEGEEVKFKILRDFRTKNLTLTQGEFKVVEREYGHTTIPFTDTILDSGQTYENRYRINEFNTEYEYYFIFQEDSMYPEEGLNYFDVDGGIGNGFTSKKIDTAEFVINAYDLSDTPEGEYNEFAGRVFVKYRGKYYYGSEIFPGFFDLTLDGKVEQIKSEVGIFGKYGFSYDERINFTQAVNTALDQYKKTLGDDAYNQAISELLIAVDQAIHSIIDTISSQDDITQNSEKLRKLLVVEEILKNILWNKDQDTMDDIFNHSFDDL